MGAHTNSPANRRELGEWEMFDLALDPDELRSVYDDPRYTAVRDQLKAPPMEVVLSLLAAVETALRDVASKRGSASWPRASRPASRGPCLPTAITSAWK